MMRLSLSSLPETYAAGRIRYEKGWQKSKRHLNRPALYYIYSGSLRFTLDGRSILLLPGTAFLLTRGYDYAVRAEEDCDYCYFHFSMPESTEEEIYIEKPKSTVLPARETSLSLPVAEPIKTEREQVEHLAAMALKYASCSKQYDKARLDLTLLRLFLLLGEELRAPTDGWGTGQSRSTYLAMRDYIESHYTDALSLSAVSRETGISPQYAARVFRRHAGQSVTAYIQGVRLRKSREMLRYTPLKIAEIAYAVGFSSPYYYSRLFTRTFGTSPTDFRRAAREEL